MRVLGLLFILFNLGFCENFMTDMEYGQMLYKNPRGIGCNKCHGQNGEGSVIANYKEHNKTSNQFYDAKLVAPPINNISLNQFAKGVADSNDVMPSYFLTNKEIITLYKYIQEINKEKK